MILPSLTYEGNPYQVLDHRSGALALTIASMRRARDRSGSLISAMAACRACSPAALSWFMRASAFSSLARFFIAAFSSAENPLDVLAVGVALFADFWAVFLGLIETSSD